MTSPSEQLPSDEKLPQIRENHRRAWLGVGDSDKYQTQAERDRKDLLEIIANQERPPPEGYDSWYDAAVDERMRRVAAERRIGRLQSAFRQARADIAVGTGTFHNAASFGLEPEDIGVELSESMGALR